jgi:SAM-dependent methyltransferase
MLKFLHRLLDHPRIFEWQQRLCNNYSAIRRHFSEYLEVSGKDVLDIGCSTGTCAATVVSMTDNRYTGIDIEARYVERARKLYPAGRFECMDARALEFDDDSFDVVMFVGALHHMDDGIVRDCFASIRRVLRPTGVVLCAEPVFTRGKFFSNLLLRNDRGRHIRDEPGYRGLFTGLHVARQDYFRLSIHRFCSFVLTKSAGQNAPAVRAA